MRQLIIYIGVWLMTLSGVTAQSTLGIDEKLGNTVPEGIYLINENDDTVELRSVMSKPTVLSLVYYRCPGICSPLMEGIATVINKSDMVPGKDYEVFTVSFDPREDIELGRRKKKNYLNLMNKEGANEGWRFFTSDSANVAKLTQAVGFNYERQGNDFIHSATLIFISPSGKITRYLNGVTFLPLEFKLALMDASKGLPGATINKVLQFCYSFDSKGKGYVLNITRLAGITITFFALVLFTVLLVRSFKRRTV